MTSLIMMVGIVIIFLLIGVGLFAYFKRNRRRGLPLNLKNYIDVIKHPYLSLLVGKELTGFVDKSCEWGFSTKFFIIIADKNGYSSYHSLDEIKLTDIDRVFTFTTSDKVTHPIFVSKNKNVQVSNITTLPGPWQNWLMNELDRIRTALKQLEIEKVI